ncbi:MAG: glycosyltransferase family 9 protein [Planctomycetes bacterium]|nr:glycosyltransferase family 9 protein [Planctomycetota bacterium]
MSFWGPGTGLYASGRTRGPARNPDAPPKDGIRRLLVLNFGQLGDTVLSLPALDVLRDHYPDAEFTMVCGMPAHELLNLWGRSDRLFAMDRVRVRDINPIVGAFLICQSISGYWKPTPDAVVVIHPISEINLIAYGARIRRRAGIVPRRGFFSSLINEPLEGTWKKCHASASYLALVHQFCGLPAPDLTKPPVPRLELPDAPVRNGRIAIHVGAGRKERRVPPKVWAEVGNALHNATGKQIAFVGGPEELGLADELARSISGASVLGGGDILSLARDLAASGFFIGSDSGPGHLAASVDTPVLTIIEEHKSLRYRTLGPTTATVMHRNITDVTPTAIIDAALRHPVFTGARA